MPALPPEAMTTPAAGSGCAAHPVEHAARLEAAADLQLLELEPELGAVDGEPAALDAHERRATHVAGDATARALDVGAGDVFDHRSSAPRVAQPLYCADGRFDRALRAGPRARARAGGHEHRQPRIEPRADPLHSRRARAPRRREHAHLRRRAPEGQPLRHRRRGQARRRDRLGPHRHRAVGRPELVARPARCRGPRWSALRPRQRRHEELHRPGAGAGAGLPRRRPAVRHAPRVQLRRGGRLLRCAAPDRRPARARHPAARLHRRRADRDGAGAGAQGRVPLALLHQGPCGAFVADAPGA